MCDRLEEVKSLVAFITLALAVIAVSARAKEDRSDVTRVSRVLAEAAQRKKSAAALALRRPNLASTDVGNIAVIQDDGTLVVPVNLFNLANRSFLFTPFAGGGYTVTSLAAQFDTASAQAGQQITLADDDFHLVALGFVFPYFGQTYSSVFLNSDGNLTFTAGDVEITARDLGRFAAGHPRIAPFFADLNPSQGGTVTVSVLPDRAVFSWLAVPYCCVETMALPVAMQTFQAILFQDGRIQFNYGAVQGQSAIVGISPGAAANGSPANSTTIDYTKLSSGMTTSGA